MRKRHDLEFINVMVQRCDHQRNGGPTTVLSVQARQTGDMEEAGLTIKEDYAERSTPARW